MDNNISFQNDEYLQKYCSYPQQEFMINFFDRDTIISKGIISTVGKFQETFDKHLNEKVECNICYRILKKNILL